MLLNIPNCTSKQTLVFQLEGALLKSSSLFHYFMLVAFEAGGILRAFILLLLYPFVWLLGENHGLKIMVFISFAGIRKDKFKIGSSVLHKFLLEDVGFEGFNVVMRFTKKVAVTRLPRVMVQSFLKDYMGVDGVIGRELKVVNGYFIGIMQKEILSKADVSQVLGDGNTVGLGSCNSSLDRQLFLYCKEIYHFTQAEKNNWETLPRKRYPKPLIFHDGRLAFRPTPVATLLMFMWLPFGFLILLLRVMIGIFLPYKISLSLQAMTGLRSTISQTKSEERSRRGSTLYVCNHRTLLDPVYLSLLLKKPVAAVTYSLSRVSEAISPVKNVRLTRDRETDRRIMEEMLRQGDLIVCPEGTTCREPYLLRFSPLFTEIRSEIVPVAIQQQVSMFYGSTASGLKCLDAAFHLLNPCPAYTVKLLDRLKISHTCKAQEKTKFEVANDVQNKISNALGFECTNLTRKEKYMILAGTEGIPRGNSLGFQQLQAHLG